MQVLLLPEQLYKSNKKEMLLPFQPQRSACFKAAQKKKKTMNKRLPKGIKIQKLIMLTLNYGSILFLAKPHHLMVTFCVTTIYVQCNSVVSTESSLRKKGTI